MEGTLGKMVSYVLYALIGISALFGLLFYIGVIQESLLIIWTYLLLGLAIAVAVGFSMAKLFTNKESAKRSLISILAIVVFIFIAYLFASDEILIFAGYEKFFYEDQSMDPNTFSKVVGTGIWSMYILFTLAIVSVLYSGISKSFK